ncbi:sensor histidine kinase [Clostridium sardiniense]|uniref:sensor histidine kinase n=1 Tax=Clostridium sardiniense TaxID=29369 RepID=UPI003D33E4EE
MINFEMKSYNLVLRIIVILGVIGITINDSGDGFLLSLYVVGFLILSFMQGLIRKKYKYIFFISLIIWNLIFYYLGMEITSALITLLLIEICASKLELLVPLIIISTMFVALFYKENFIPFYIYTTILGVFFIRIFSMYDRKVIKLEDDMDKKIKESHSLKQKIKNESDFYKQSIYSVKLEERNDVSRRMHDNVGHVIAASLMRLEAAQIILDTDIDKGRDMIKETTENLRKGMDDIRKTIHEITPRSEEVGVNKIKLLLEEKLKGSKIKYSVMHSGNIDKVTIVEWAVIYEGIKELSTNSIKYSNCDKITVNIEILDKLLKVTFKDNGSGKEKIIKGYGLTKLEEEVLKQRGNLIIDGSDGFTAIMIFYK